MRRTASILGSFMVVALVVIPLVRGRAMPRGNTESNKLRIVSLAPSVTEMLFALRVGDCIVGVTNRCDYPPEVKDIERVGGFGAPNMEKLLALSPDLVIINGMQRGDAVVALRQAGIRTLQIETGNFSELFEAFGQLGREVGKTRRADEVVAAMRAELQAIAQRHQTIPRDQRPRVFVELWNDPTTTVGKGSFIDDIITRAGGINVAGEIDTAYPKVNPEKVIQWNPDVIVLCYMSRQQPAEELGNRIGWSNIAAVRSGKIVNDVPNELFLRPGPRLIEGVKALNARLYGTAGEGNSDHAR